MAKKKIDRRSGGVYIDGGARVKVEGDLVGRDKISIGADDQKFEVLFTRLCSVIENRETLTTEEKRELVAKSEELKEELKKPEPDLGKVNRLKQFLLSKGGWIASAVGAIFQYPPVQETIKAVAQRLIGG